MANEHVLTCPIHVHNNINISLNSVLTYLKVYTKNKKVQHLTYLKRHTKSGQNNMKKDSQIGRK